jgi:FKBP-type peptidyl-prolyl cis-trans isomerase
MVRKFNQAVFLFITAILIVSLWSCDPSKKLEKEENAKIQEYLGNNSMLNFVHKTSGLYYLEVLAGTGIIPADHDTAYVKYTGKFLDGTVFDTNVGTTDTLIFPVNEGWIIAGIDEGVSYMASGGKAIFLVPSNLGFGASGNYFINGYTPLLFDIELIKVKPGSTK